MSQSTSLLPESVTKDHIIPNLQNIKYSSSLFVRSSEFGTPRLLLGTLEFFSWWRNFFLIFQIHPSSYNYSDLCGIFGSRLSFDRVSKILYRECICCACTMFVFFCVCDGRPSGRDVSRLHRGRKCIVIYGYQPKIIGIGYCTIHRTRIIQVVRMRTNARFLSERGHYVWFRKRSYYPIRCDTMDWIPPGTEQPKNGCLLASWNFAKGFHNIIVPYYWIGQYPIPYHSPVCQNEVMSRRFTRDLTHYGAHGTCITW